MSRGFPEWFTPPDILSGYDKDESVLIGFSGGADSTALLHLLSIYSKITGVKVYAAHINHGLRGKEADRDEEFCRMTAEKYGVEFFTAYFDVPRLAKESGDGIEGTGRRVRHEFFAKIMAENNIKLLALAHHADDNLETVIFNLSRGSGANGMGGIPPVRKFADGLIIRPLINASKAEILEYCRENHLDFVTDSTNSEDDCVRNLIRHNIVPELIKINPSAHKSARRMTDAIREDREALDFWAEAFIKENPSIPADKLSKLPPAIAKRVIRAQFGESVPDGLTSNQLESILTLAGRGVPHSSLTLCMDLQVGIENGNLVLKSISNTIPESQYDVALKSGVNIMPDGNTAVFIGETSQDSLDTEAGRFIRFSYAELDCSAVSHGLSARTRRDSDSINTMNMTKTLKKLYCERKVPLELRKILPLICDGAEIILIPGYAIATGKEYKAREKLTVSVYFSEKVFNQFFQITGRTAQ